MLRTVSNGQSIHPYIPPDLQRMFYKNPAAVHASQNGLDPYGFSTNGLVLYLPLWALKGDAFKSIDANQYSFNVTGALWQPDSRLFDGDDYIKYPSRFRSSDSSGTFLVWFKSSTNNDALLGVSDEATAINYLWLATQEVTGFLYVEERSAGGQNRVVGDVDVGDGEWHLGMLKSSGTAWTIGHDKVDDGLTVEVGANNGNWLADNATLDNFTIGAVERSSVIIYWVGNIGEVLYYNRAITTGERDHFYDSTVWRYQ